MLLFPWRVLNVATCLSYDWFSNSTLTSCFLLDFGIQQRLNCWALSRSCRITFYLHVLIPEWGAKPLQWLPGCLSALPRLYMWCTFTCPFSLLKEKKLTKKKKNQGVEFIWNKQKISGKTNSSRHWRELVKFVKCIWELSLMWNVEKPSGAAKPAGMGLVW